MATFAVGALPALLQHVDDGLHAVHVLRAEPLALHGAGVLDGRALVVAEVGAVHVVLGAEVEEQPDGGDVDGADGAVEGRLFHAEAVLHDAVDVLAGLEQDLVARGATTALGKGLNTQSWRCES